MRALDSTLGRLKARHGARFSEAYLVDRFRPWFDGERVEVCRTYPDGTTWTRRGRVGMSCGWAPVFLLLSRRGARSSGDVLQACDHVTRVVPARKGAR